jgi:hypothetical protein
MNFHCTTTDLFQHEFHRQLLMMIRFQFLCNLCWWCNSINTNMYRTCNPSISPYHSNNNIITPVSHNPTNLCVLACVLALSVSCSVNSTLVISIDIITFTDNGTALAPTRRLSWREGLNYCFCCCFVVVFRMLPVRIRRIRLGCKSRRHVLPCHR